MEKAKSQIPETSSTGWNLGVGENQGERGKRWFGWKKTYSGNRKSVKENKAVY